MLLQLVSVVIVLAVSFSLLPVFVKIIRPQWRQLREEVAFLLYCAKDLNKQLFHLLTVMYSFDVYFFDFTGINLCPPEKV